MNNQDNYDKQLNLIYDETNVSETNWIKSALEITLKFFIVLVLIYITTYISLGIVIDNLSTENQIKLENFIANLIKEPKKITTEKEIKKFQEIKTNILNIDPNFPTTSKLNIYLIKDDQKNALCLPNGNIYITSALYEALKDDEMLTFVIAHEMAHYRNRDHLKNIRHMIAKNVIVALLFATNPSNTQLTKAIDTGLEINNLNYSRHYEKKADIYAGQVSLILFNSTEGGVKTLEILRNNKYKPVLAIFSTHPDIDSRIKALNKLRL